MTHPFLEKLKSAWDPEEWQDLTVLVCVSAGSDSVALLRGLASLKTTGAGRLVVAHFNHGLRGEASMADERFTRDLCQELEIPIEVGSPARPPQCPADVAEAAARTARYAFFTEAAKALGARFVVTAHTADDQAETILHRIVRGTGIGGLGGVPRHRLLTTGITMLRPLLAVTRREVSEYLASLPQAFREDASNADRRFTRNRIRRELLPELTHHYNPQVRSALVRLGTLATDAQVVIESLCADQLNDCVRQAGPHQLQIACPSLQAFPLAVRREILVTLWKRLDWPLQEMGFDHWCRLADMLLESPPVSHHTLPGDIRAVRVGKQLQLTRPT